MRRKIIRCLLFGLILAVFVLVFTDSTVWTQGQVIIVEPMDSLAFQALVDSAVPHTTIKCLGGLYPCYQGNPEDNEPHPIRITKSLRIVAADENDPPLFKGTFGDSLPYESTNNGFMVYNLRTDIRGLEFKGLQFEGFIRSLAFSPNYDPANPTIPIEGGVLSRLKVTRCQFYDCKRGVQVFGGQTENFEISNNNIDAKQAGIIVYGGATAAEPGGIIYDCGRPRNGIITGNTVSMNGTGIPFGIWISACERVTVRNNFVDNGGGGYGIAFGDDLAYSLPDDGPINIGSVIGNDVQNAEVGIGCNGPTTLHKSLIRSNSISDCYYAIALEVGANNFYVADNQFNNISIHIWLESDTHDNTIIVSEEAIVEDNGTNNQIIIR